MEQKNSVGPAMTAPRSLRARLEALIAKAKRLGTIADWNKLNRLRRGAGGVMAKRTYDSMVARIAGNIASGPLGAKYQEQAVKADWTADVQDSFVAHRCVALARDIVAEVQRTEPESPEGA